MGSRPKTVIFWPFLAFEGRFGGLKDLLEVRVEGETWRTVHGTHFEGILSQNNWTGSAGGHCLVNMSRGFTSHLRLSNLERLLLSSKDNGTTKIRERDN